MEPVIISYEESAQRHGLSVSEFKENQEDLVKAGYMKKIKNKDGSICFMLTSPDPVLAKELSKTTRLLKFI